MNPTHFAQVIRLDGPNARDHARALVGVARRHALVVIVQPIVVGALLAGVVLLGLMAMGLAR